MTNEKLIAEVKDAACSCEPMAGWTCSFCRETLPKLRQALAPKFNPNRKSPYEPIGAKGLRL